MAENIGPEDNSSENEPAEPRTFTQEQVEQIVRKRLANVKAAPPADYEELKAKAAKYDEAEEAAKSELERTLDAVAKERERADAAESRVQAMERERERARAVKEAAAEYGVDEETLSRMSGDVAENAAFLKARTPKAPAYPQVNDPGAVSVPDMSLEDIRNIKDPAERIRKRAEFIENHRQ